MKQLLNCILFFFFVNWLVSCKPSDKIRQQLVYFKNVKDSSLAAAQVYEAVIQKGDILGITVSGSVLEQETVEPILKAINNNTSSGTSSTTSTASGYLVDETGNITMPFIGSVKADGLTKMKLAEALKEKLKKNIPEPVVSIQFLNYKITVLGEVNRPGTVRISNERVTILDAIGEAGDLNIDGKRENIMIIRDSDGKKDIGRINLNDGNIFTSPYYFLKQNDVVYVEPNKLKIPESQNDRTFRYVQLGLAIVTSISLLLNIFR